ncbi:hypothetical protein ACRALDRAFT_2051275 [Sodiomyces alcalophilus JCM 7366]|uniref:uncharacterized protein n=1 Tax=Sodiomyces alcalophilus JCM 7366 TaxID=591952 RepID=UPI0039B483EC
MNGTDWTSYKRGPITPAVLHEIYSSDQDMYPAPLPFDRLQDWVDAAGDSFSFAIYGDPNPISGEEAVLGAVIALPLRITSWNALLTGKLKETFVTASRDLWTPDDSERRMGLHIFHVEVYRDAVAGPRVPGFTQHVIKEIVETLNTQGVAIEGLSDQGRRCFLKLGFEPTGYEEIWVRTPDGPAELVTPNEKDPTRTRLGEVVGRAQMMVKMMVMLRGRTTRKLLPPTMSLAPSTPSTPSTPPHGPSFQYLDYFHLPPLLLSVFSTQYLTNDEQSHMV